MTSVPLDHTIKLSRKNTRERNNARRKRILAGLNVKEGVLQPDSIYDACYRSWDHWWPGLMQAMPDGKRGDHSQIRESFRSGFYAPFRALKAWSNIASLYTKTDIVPGREFFDFIFELTARHALFTGRVQLRQIGWRADCLAGMLRKIEREESGEGRRTRQRMNTFISRMLELCTAQALLHQRDLPLLSVYMDPSKKPLLRCVLKFLAAAGETPDEGCEPILEDLWRLTKYLHGIHDKAGCYKKLAIKALWLDLKLQSILIPKALSKYKKSYDFINSFLFHLGDRKWCELADQTFGLFDWHSSLVARIKEENSRRKFERRLRTGAKSKRTTGNADPKVDIFHNAKLPSRVKSEMRLPLSLQKVTPLTR